MLELGKSVAWLDLEHILEKWQMKNKDMSLLVGFALLHFISTGCAEGGTLGESGSDGSGLTTTGDTGSIIRVTRLWRSVNSGL